MTPPQESQGILIDEADLDAMAVESESARPIRRARDPVTEFREFHGWTLDKLDVFDTYLKLYRRVAGGGAYIDAFAGTGHGVSTTLRRDGQRDGSSVIAAKSGAFSSLHLIECDSNHLQMLRRTVGALSDRLASRVCIHHGDCNAVIPELLTSDTLDATRPCFAFLDQESTQLNWDTVETLASWKTYRPPPTMTGRPKTCKVELWILFNSHQAIYRLWPHDRQKYPESFSPDTLDRVFGSREAWWDLWENNEPASALVFRFANQLRRLGYQYVLPQLFNDRSTGRPQYHMLHATDHPSAVSFMRWAKRSTDGYETQRLPGLESNT